MGWEDTADASLNVRRMNKTIVEVDQTRARAPPLVYDSADHELRAKRRRSNGVAVGSCGDIGHRPQE